MRRSESATFLLEDSSVRLGKGGALGGWGGGRGVSRYSGVYMELDIMVGDGEFNMIGEGGGGELELMRVGGGGSI